MRNFNFKNKIVINSNSELKKIIGLDNIFLGENSKVEFNGSFSLADNIYFNGNCIFKDSVSIGSGSIIENSCIGNDTLIRPYSIINDSEFGQNNLIGPFCFIRDQTVVGDSCIVGSHVEIARTKLGNNVKISHQSYIGDALIGNNTIIGAGSVFCNYDGKQRQKSIIGEMVTIGSGSMIVSPIKIGNNSLIAAGSVITKDIKKDTKFIQRR